MSLATLLVVITATFFLMRAMPGKPFTGAKAVPKAIMENLERKYGLDKPVLVQYGIFLQNTLKGDLGISMTYKNRKVIDIIKTAFPVSANLGIRSILFGVLAGIFFGVIASLNHNKPLDSITMILAILGVSIPGFILATMVQYLFGFHMSNALKELFNTDYQFLPIGRWEVNQYFFEFTIPFINLPIRLQNWEGFKYTILPAIALGFGSLASTARLMRTSMLDVLHQDYIKTAKAKGLSTAQVTIKHAIRNAILPVVTVLGWMIAAILTGTFIIEQIFAIPGLGKFFVQSVQMYDYTMIMGLTIFYASFLILMNFLVDLTYGLVDPRIRLAKGKV